MSALGDDTMPTLTDTELDQAYTHLCKTMTRLGEANASLFLARFALLAMTRIGDAEAAQRLVDTAAEDVAPAAQN